METIRFSRYPKSGLARGRRSNCHDKTVHRMKRAALLHICPKCKGPLVIGYPCKGDPESGPAIQICRKCNYSPCTSTVKGIHIYRDDNLCRYCGGHRS